MILQLAVIFGFLALGELVVWLTGWSIPSGIIGMLLLTACLHTGIVRPKWVEGASNLLLNNLGLFFVPAGVGLMECLGLLSKHWAAIITATAASTFVVICITGWVHQLARRFTDAHTAE